MKQLNGECFCVFCRHENMLENHPTPIQATGVVLAVSSPKLAEEILMRRFGTEDKESPNTSSFVISQKTYITSSLLWNLNKNLCHKDFSRYIEVYKTRVCQSINTSCWRKSCNRRMTSLTWCTFLMNDKYTNKRKLFNVTTRIWLISC